VKNQRWGRFAAGLVCILTLLTFAPQLVMAAEEPVAAPVAEVSGATTPAQAAVGNPSCLDGASTKAEGQAGALAGVLFLTQVPTHSCPFPCTPTFDCRFHCSVEGYVGMCVNGCCNCF